VRLTCLKLQTIVLFQILFVTSAFAQYNFNTYFAKAKINIDDKNYTEAITNLNICILAQPNNCEVYYFRAACKYSLSDNIGAEQDFTKALSVYSSIFYEACRYRSLVRYQLGNYPGAIEDINKVIDKQITNPVLYIERAFFFLANNNFSSAINDCDKAISLKSLGEDVYFCKAIAEDALSNYTDALRDYDKVIKLNPHNDDAYIRRGMTKFKMGNYNDAIDDYNCALKHDSVSTFAFYNRAEAEVKLNENKKAISDYDTVLHFEPRNAYAYFNRAVLYAGEQKYKTAIEDFNKVLLLNPNNIQALFNRAKLKQNIDDFKGAIADYDKIIELYPYFMEAYYYRSHLKTSIKDYSGAKKDIETGKIMSALYHNKSKTQLNLDSLLLNKLTYLSADFYKSDDIKSDTVNITFLPVFYLTDKDSGNFNTKFFSTLLYNYNSKNKQSLCLKNSIEDEYDTAIINSNIDLNQTSNEIPLVTAIHKSNMQMFNEANEIFDKIIAVDSLNALAYFARGVNTCREIELMKNTNEPYFITSSKQNIFENERHEKCQSAHADFAKTLKLIPDFPFAYYNIGYVKCLLGDFNGALYDYEQAIKLNPGFADAYYNYGFLLYYLNYKQEACQNLSKAGELGLASAFQVIKKYCSGVITK
jgi:tetratricopeptide (TPR) repeat protein